MSNDVINFIWSNVSGTASAWLNFIIYPPSSALLGQDAFGHFILKLIEK